MLLHKPWTWTDLLVGKALELGFHQPPGRADDSQPNCGPRIPSPLWSTSIEFPGQEIEALLLCSVTSCVCYGQISCQFTWPSNLSDRFFLVLVVVVAHWRARVGQPWQAQKTPLACISPMLNCKVALSCTSRGARPSVATLCTVPIIAPCVFTYLVNADWQVACPC